MTYDISNIQIKPNAEKVISRSGKIYYKSLYNTIKKYNDKNRQKINEVSRERYRNDEIYKEQNRINGRIRYYKKLSLKDTEEEIKNIMNIDYQ